MLKKDYAVLIKFLNKVRVRNIVTNVGIVVNTHFISKNNLSYLIQALHIYAENRSA